MNNHTKPQSGFDEAILLLHQENNTSAPKDIVKKRKTEEEFHWEIIEHTLKDHDSENFVIPLEHEKNRQHMKKLRAGLFLGIFAGIGGGGVIGPILGPGILTGVLSMVLMLAGLGCFMAWLMFDIIPFANKKLAISDKQRHEILEMIGYGALTAASSKKEVYQKMLELYQKDQHNAHFWGRLLWQHRKILNGKKNAGLPDGVQKKKTDDMSDLRWMAQHSQEDEANMVHMIKDHQKIENILERDTPPSLKM